MDALDQRLFRAEEKERVIKKPKKGEFVGSPVRFVWVLRARETGSTVIRMSYYRIWEGKEKALQRFEVGIDIIP